MAVTSARDALTLRDGLLEYLDRTMLGDRNGPLSTKGAKPPGSDSSA